MEWLLKSRIRVFFLLAVCSSVAFSQPRSTDTLRRQIEQHISAAQGRVGVAVTVLETGESVTLLGDQQFPMQSVYKFPIGMAVLYQIDQAS